jgi:hypothetical protein
VVENRTGANGIIAAEIVAVACRRVHAVHGHAERSGANAATRRACLSA